MPNYAIEAAIFKLPIPFYKRFTHNFWVLKRVEEDTVIAQLHGLATSRTTGDIVPIGYRGDHSLRAHCFVYDESFANQCRLKVSTFRLPIHSTSRVYTDKDCIDRWFKAIEAVKAINGLDLNYPRCGLNFPLSNTINSNSLYHTFAQVMALPLPVFRGMFPIGIKTSVYEQIKGKLG